MEFSTFIRSNNDSVKAHAIPSPMTTFMELSNFPAGQTIVGLLIGLKLLSTIGRGILKRNRALPAKDYSSTWNSILEFFFSRQGEVGISVDSLLSMIQTECDVPTTNRQKRRNELDSVDGKTTEDPTTARMVRIKITM
jgi:hypothetical protein